MPLLDLYEDVKVKKYKKQIECETPLFSVSDQIENTESKFQRLEKAGSSSAAPASSVVLTPFVIRGTQHKYQSQSMSIDWMRWTGPIENFDKVFELFKQILDIDQSDFVAKNGLYFYADRLVHQTKVQVCYDRFNLDNDAKSMLVELSGEVLKIFGHEKSMELNYFLYANGFRFTRVDIALDAMGNSIDIIDNVINACDSGYMTRVRTFQPMRKMTSGQFRAYGVNLGSRESSIYYRFYDKGLEQDKDFENDDCKYEVGDWVRCELEVKQERAAIFGEILGRFGPNITSAEFIKSSKNMILGHVDFRSGNKKHNIARRKRLKFWSDFMDSTELVDSIIVKRTKTDADRHHAWLKRCVIPAIKSVSDYSGISIADLWEKLGKNVPAYDDTFSRPLIWQYHQKLIVHGSNDLDLDNYVDSYECAHTLQQMEFSVLESVYEDVFDD